MTLGQIMIHVIDDLARHAGQRTSCGSRPTERWACMSPGDNVPEIDFPAYVAKLTELADRF